MVDRICVNCRHFRLDETLTDEESKVRFGHCDIARYTNPVTGGTIIDYCQIQRGTVGNCGPSGTLFEPKEYFNG